MLSGKDILVFSDEYGRHPCSCQHIMRQFMPNNRVLWVNTIGMRNPQFSLYDFKRSIEKIKGWMGKGRHRQSERIENLTVINPVMIPYNNFKFIRNRNKESVVRTVLDKMSEMGIQKPIFMATLPNAADYVGAFGESVTVYYCVDDFTHWPGVNQRLISDMEEQLLVKSDFICASAEELCNIKERNSVRPFLLPHGVDYDHFANATKSAPNLFPDIRRPVIGFFGAISPWLDFDLIVDLARNNSSWSFVFVGPADVDITKLASIPNVHALGKVSYHQLPNYAANFDVALIPFLVNDLTISVNPLKLLEYLACGLPVVSTPLPEVKKYEDIVYLADSSEKFAEAIELALAEDSPLLRQNRMQTARSRSWQAVSEILSNEIESVISSKIHEGDK